METSDQLVKDALRAATEARNRAYAPYSKFKMGAAVVTSSGAVVSGALVENVSLGLAMCAELASNLQAGAKWPGGVVAGARS
jgi:cytidine deaminase